MSKELTIHIKDTSKKGQDSKEEITIPMDEDQIERLAAAFGLLSDEAMEAIEQSQKDYENGDYYDFDEMIARTKARHGG